ncbi:MAG TPA: alanine/glycine:cation symporter family protein [Candidatus Methanomethylophilaceae archaeon]|nr:alanine/glycine:cation symporter family protein [Candidatus Methanomethylophilaceae archaeon]
MALSELLNEIVNLVDTYIWYLGLVLIIGIGLFLSYKLKGIQITHFVESVKLVFFGGKKTNEKTVSSSEAFWVGVGARIGIGNIAGVAMAIILGGAGAVFWIWVFAIIGSASCFVECTLGQIFKEKKSDGLFHGGPAYYIRNGLKNPKFAMFIALLLILTYAIGFIGIQSSSATSSFVTAFDFEGNDILFAIILATTTGLIMFKGIKGVAKASAKIVPITAAVWFIVVIITVIFNWRLIDDAIIMIVQGAFGLDSFLGGTLGAALMWGLKRSVFSNGAGIGSVPNVSSAADVNHPVEQGLIQSFGVILDTVICTGTAFIILTSTGLASFGHIVDGVPLVAESLSTGPLGSYAPAILSIFILLFVLASIISSYSLCEANLKFISERPIYSLLMKIAIIFSVFISSLAPAKLIWSISDILMAVLGISNMVAILLLSKYVSEALKDYNRQRSAGKEPIFNKSRITHDTSGITLWGERTELDTDPDVKE